MLDGQLADQFLPAGANAVSMLLHKLVYAHTYARIWPCACAQGTMTTMSQPAQGLQVRLQMRGVPRARVGAFVGALQSAVAVAADGAAEGLQLQLLA